MAGAAECGWAGGPGSVSCSHAETQTDLPACCGSIIITLIRQLALAQGKLPPDWSSPSDTAALQSAAPAADPEVAEQTGTGAAGRTELADDSALEQGPDDEPVTDSSLQRSAGEASQEAQTAPRTGSTVAATQALVTPGGVDLVYDADIDIKIEEFQFPEGDTSQQGAAPEPNGQTTPEGGRSGANPSPAALGPRRPVRTRRKRCRSPPPPPEPVRRRRQTSRKQKAAAASQQSAGSSSSAPADGPAASPQPQPPRTARRRPTSAGSSADIGAVGAQPHTGSRSLCCPQCGKSFPTNWQLQRHELTHTGERRFPCKACGRKFRQKSHLKLHRRTHTGERPYACKECGRNFTRKGHLNLHHRTHTGEQVYSCKECGRKFSHQSSLIAHRRTHTGERPYYCEDCGRKFSESRSLITHRRTHTGERPYSCKDCGRKFSQQGNLIQHRRTHTGERPYSCKECGRKFSRQANLIRHCCTHTGEQPFSCEECGRKFSLQANLVRHRRTHTRNRQFVCCSCGQMFSPQTALSNSSMVPTGERQLQCAACKGSAALKEQDLQAPPQPPPAAPQPVPVKQEPPAPVLNVENEDSDVADDPDSELNGDDNSKPECDVLYWRKVSSQKKSASKKTAPRGRRISVSSDRDESPVERRVTPARSAKQRNTVQTTNLESQDSGEHSDADSDQFDWSGSETSWRDSSAENSDDGI